LGFHGSTFFGGHDTEQTESGKQSNKDRAAAAVPAVFKRRKTRAQSRVTEHRRAKRVRCEVPGHE
jgi:hypothetical protein